MPGQDDKSSGQFDERNARKAGFLQQLCDLFLKQ